MEKKKIKKIKNTKRYFFSVIEEMIQNPDYFGYRGGRIEVYDNQSESPYAIYEARFLIPAEFMMSFRETFDFKESDLMPYFRWDIEETK